MENKDKIEIPFGAKDSELYECEYTIPEGYEAEIKDGKVIIRKKESEDEKIKKAVIDAVETLSDSPLKVKMLAWLEKQGEPTSIPADAVLDSNKDGLIANTIRCKKERQSDKTEPKFKVGDWVMLDRPVLITKVEDMPYNTHQYWTSVGTWFGDATKAKLWTIQDAKDGDVLFVENFDNIGGCVFLFNGLDNWKFGAEDDRTIATGYCCTSITESGNTDFGIQGPDCVDIKRVHPATKEQRDTLMKVMTDAGYTFDFEKKELKKIEQKSTEWSEEDEKMLDGIIEASTHHCYLNITDIDWLKSLRPQSTWKPSKEQMNSLKEAIEFLGCTKTRREPLQSLYEQLKKLKD